MLDIPERFQPRVCIERGSQRFGAKLEAFVNGAALDRAGVTSGGGAAIQESRDYADRIY